METAISTLSYFPDTKEQSINFAEKLVNEVLSGMTDPIKVDVQLKILEDMIKKVRDQIKQNVLKEADKYGEKSFNLNGAKITISGKTTYDYKSCNYSKYNDLIDSKEKMETMLKSLTDKLVDPYTGEIILPPAKKYSPFLKIEF
jgi:hypothetical protein